MRIVFQAPADGNTIAWEEMLEVREGEFFLALDESVSYRHPSDHRIWIAGVNEGQFRDAANAWNARCEAVVAAPTEEEQDIIDRRLRGELARIGVARASWYWGVLLEQVEHGLL